MGNKCANLPVDNTMRRRLTVGQKATNIVTVSYDAEANQRNRYQTDGTAQSKHLKASSVAISRMPASFASQLSQGNTTASTETVPLTHPQAESTQMESGISRVNTRSILLNAEYKRIIERSSQVDGKEFAEWNHELQAMNTESVRFYIRKKDTHLGLQFTEDSQLNCCFVSVLCYHQRTGRMLVGPHQFLRRSEASFQTKLFFNGSWRSVRSIGRKFVWSIILEATLSNLFRERQQEDYLYRTLAWLPESIEARNLLNADVLLDYVRREFQRGRLLAGLTIGRLQAAILELEVVENRRYLAVRLGSNCELVQEFLAAAVPANLTRYMASQANMYVLQWSLLSRQHCRFQLSWLPDGECVKVTHGEFKAPNDAFLKISNFNDPKLSHYGSPQHFLTVQSHQQPVRLWILVERHLNSTAAQETLNILLYRSNQRIVYAAEPLQPISYSSYGEVVCCSYLLSAYNEQQRYCIVLERQTVVAESYFYTLSVAAEEEFELVKVPLPPTVQVRLAGTFTVGNYGESLHSTRLLRNPMCKLRVESPLQLEIKFETKDKLCRLMVVFYRLYDQQTDPLEVISHHYGHFLRHAMTGGISYCGLSYLNLPVDSGTYLLIPLLMTSPTTDTPYSLQVNCMPVNLKSALSIQQLSSVWSHSAQFTGYWLQPLEVPLCGSFTASSALLNSGYACIFKLQEEMQVSCELLAVSGRSPQRPPTLALMVVDIGRIKGQTAARKIYTTDYCQTGVGLRTRKLHLKSTNHYYGILCLSRQPGPFRLTVYSTGPLQLQRSATTARLQ